MYDLGKQAQVWYTHAPGGIGAPFLTFGLAERKDKDYEMADNDFLQ
jgi:hypothetical protein